MIKKDLVKIDGLEENISLKDKTTMRVGGRAAYYYRAENLKQLQGVVMFARKNSIDHIVLGGGSNVIFSDDGYDGLIIDNKSSEINIRSSQVVSSSGVYASKLIRALAEQGKSGLEFLSGIPATVGGLVVNNGGAFGWQISDVLVSCLILNKDNKKVVLNHSDLNFDYRNSVLKGKTEGENFPIILSAVFEIKSSSPDHVLRKINDIRKIRAKKQPSGFSSGSIFKNPKISQDNIPNSWQKIIDSKGRIPAGYLLDMAGVKGLSIGRAKVSKEHANFIINTKNAKSSDIKKLAEKMKKTVKDKYGISLKREVEFIN